MPILLIVFLTLACLPEVGPKGHWPAPLDRASMPLWVSVLLTWSTVAFMVGWAWWSWQRTCRALCREPQQRDRALRRYERMRWRYQVALFGTYIAVMCLFGWGWAVGRFWSHGDTAMPGAELLILSPFFAAMVLSWLCFYDAERAAFVATHSLSPDPLISALLEQEQPAASLRLENKAVFGGRWSYVLFKLRNTLVLVFIPLLLVLGMKELGRACPELADSWAPVLGAVSAGVALTLFPLVVRVVLNLQPLPEGSLRRHLLATAQRLHFRCNDILVWNTQGNMANAMVVGVLPWLRYVVFTDRLLEDFSQDEVEAVFGHEMGHVKHHHMLFYFTFQLASVPVLAWLVATLAPNVFEPNLTSHQYLRQVPMMLLMLGYIFVVHGFVSRRCERQADIYGCRAVSCSQSDCTGHAADVVLMPRGKGLCPTAIRTFMRALEKVAVLNGINRDRPGFLQSWQHSTIARRVAFLHGMLSDPSVEPRFQRRLLRLKCGLFVALGLVVAGLGFHAWVQPEPPAGKTEDRGSKIEDREDNTDLGPHSSLLGPQSSLQG